MEEVARSIALKDIAVLLEKRCGLVFAPADYGNLQRKLEERMRDVGVRYMADYHALLTSHPNGAAEMGQLMTRVTINETFFFRIPAHFRVLGEEALPFLSSARKSARSLRVWSAGCSTGEEVYSIAISIAESHLFAGWDVKVVGTDISQKVVEKAVEGVYRGRSVQTVPSRLLADHFQQRPDGYSVSSDIRSQCDFRPHNLVQDPPPLPRCDVVVFRNVMIYFQAETTRRILDKIYRSLADDGFLIIGPSETLWQLSDRFYPHYRGDCFIYRKFPDPLNQSGARGKPAETGPARTPDRPPARPPPSGKPPALPRRAASSAPSTGAADREKVRLAREFLSSGGFPEAANILDTLAPSEETLYLQSVASLSMGKMDRFVQAKDALLERDPIHAEVRFLHAVYLSSKGLKTQAMEELKKILFIDDALIQPRYLQMLMLEKDGRGDLARQEARAILKLVEAGRAGKFREKLYTRVISEADIGRHCKEIAARGE